VASSACSPCPPGTAAANPGATQCQACPTGTYSALPGSQVCTACDVGRYNGQTGGASPASCIACPEGTTTLSSGAILPIQCVVVPRACALGEYLPTPNAPACAPLSCPPPLRPSAYAASATDAAALAQSRSCQGCLPGTSGVLPACAACRPSDQCPGLTSRPLYNFSADAVVASGGAPRALAPGGGGTPPTSPFSACPALASLTGSVAAAATQASAATSTVFFGVPLPTTSSQSLLAWVVIFTWLFILAMLVAFSRTSENATGCSALPLRALKAADLFSLHHNVNDMTSPIKVATPLGGIFSLMGLTTLLTYAAYMVATWLQDNTLVQQSLTTMGPQVWGRVAALPWAAPPSSASPLGSLALRLSIDGNPGACAAPLSMTTTGLSQGAFALSSTADCGGSGVSQHTLTCPACRLTSDTSITLVFDYSCQAMLLEALGASPAYPGPLTLSALAAPPALTAAPKPGALLTSLTWQLTPVLSVLWDNVTAANSAIGWEIADSKLTLAPPLTPTALNGSLSIIPTASPVTVTLALSLSSTYSSTLLTQRVPVTQLLANIVGLSGLLAFFGMAFGSFEGYCARRTAGAHKPPPLSSSEGGGRGPSVPESPPLPLTQMARSPLLRHRSSVFRPPPGGSSAQLQSSSAAGSGTEQQQVEQQVEADSQREGAAFAVDNPLLRASFPASRLRADEAALAGGLDRRAVLAEEAAQGGAAAAAVVVWQRHSDATGEVWYTSSSGDTAWDLPQGAALLPQVPPAPLPLGEQALSAGSATLQASAPPSIEAPQAPPAASLAAGPSEGGSFTVQNPLSEGSPGAGAPPRNLWKKRREGEEVWYENAATGETSWTLPQDAVVTRRGNLSQ
jgi:hypothetical protein